jgi:hypothetical protein
MICAWRLFDQLPLNHGQGLNMGLAWLMISTGSQPCIRRTILRLSKALYSCVISYEENLEGIGIQVYGHTIRSRFWTRCRAADHLHRAEIRSSLILVYYYLDTTVYI